MFDYSPLWETMKVRGITQYQLIKAGVDKKMMERLRKNKNITVSSLEKICKILDCTPNDVVRFTDKK